MKDHEIRELVNQLRDIAIEYHGTQQLRERIARTVRAAMFEASTQSPGSEPATVPGKWIPVSERMPEKNGTYQVWNGEHVGAVPFLFGSFQCLNPEQVTHWMPTAKPPREVK